VVSSRRTVRVAIALAAGQAALCGVIGWVTFGPGLGGSAAGNPLDEVAAPPAVMPAPSIGVPPAPLPAPPASKPAAKNTRARERPAADAQRTTRAPEPPARPSSTPVPTPTPTPSPAGTQSEAAVPPEPHDPNGLIGSSAPEPTSASAPAEVGGECDDEGATGVTVDDLAVVCVRGQDGVLRWQLARAPTP
jgi:hypothetical protein